jgi:predicted dehydrogenase
MGDEPLRFGIVGCGVIAPTHRTAIDACEQAELVAVCDIDEDVGREFAEESGGVRFYRDVEKLVADPEVDVVSVCTPGSSRRRGDCGGAGGQARLL